MNDILVTIHSSKLIENQMKEYQKMIREYELKIYILNKQLDKLNQSYSYNDCEIFRKDMITRIKCDYDKQEYILVMSSLLFSNYYSVNKNKNSIVCYKNENKSDKIIIQYDGLITHPFKRNIFELTIDDIKKNPSWFIFNKLKSVVFKYEYIPIPKVLCDIVYQYYSNFI